MWNKLVFLFINHSVCLIFQLLLKLHNRDWRLELETLTLKVYLQYQVRIRIFNRLITWKNDENWNYQLKSTDYNPPGCLFIRFWYFLEWSFKTIYFIPDLKCIIFRFRIRCFEDTDLQENSPRYVKIINCEL